jgi:hypothetical protein
VEGGRSNIRGAQKRREGKEQVRREVKGKEMKREEGKVGGGNKGRTEKGTVLTEGDEGKGEK